MFLKHLFRLALACCALVSMAGLDTKYTTVNIHSPHPEAYCYPNEDVVLASPLDLLITKHAASLGLDRRVLRSLINYESGFIVDAYNPDDPSYGLGQVMPKYWRYVYIEQCGSEATPETLMDPEINICYSAHILRYFIDRYGPVAGVDAYNNGTGASRGYSTRVLGAIK